ncbi:MAG: T9SS type A sorting domain-containing protein [Bacteroidales bacterium]|nr:T9SS type A sorting domain-containing protein [Bacteroidales bacterium]
MKKIIFSVLLVIATANLFAQPTANITPANPQICYGTCTVITCNASGGTQPYSYSWTNVNDSAVSNHVKTVCPNYTTTYTVTVHDAASGTATAQAVVSVIPAPYIYVDNDSICQGNVSTLCASGGIAYTWSTGETASCITVLPTAFMQYSVMGANANGCIGYANVAVFQNDSIDNVSAKGGTVCNSTALTITASGAVSYTWSHGLGTGSAKTVLPTVTTTYIVAGTASCGCTFSAEAVVYVNPTLVMQVNEGTICKGSSFGLMASGGTSYTWSNSQVQINAPVHVYPTTNTTYTVTGINAAGCTGTAQAVVNVFPEPHFVISEKYICSGDIAPFVDSVIGSTPTYYVYMLNNNDSNSFTYINGVPYAIPDSTTEFLIRITYGGCSTDTIRVKVHVNENCIHAGIVYNDANNNGIRDVGEVGIPNIILKGMPGPVYASSDKDGKYFTHNDGNTYTYSIPNPPKYCTILPLTQIVTNLNDTTNDFGLHFGNINDLRVSLTAGNRARPGFDVYYYINYENMGTSILYGYVQLVHDNHLTFTSSTPVHSYNSNDTVKWNFTNLIPGESRSIFAKLLMSSSVPLGDTLNSVVKIYPIDSDTFPPDNVDTLHQIVTGSFDPNDKQVSFASLTPQEVQNEPYITYVIRFQNTGTDTAFTVVVKDTLDNNLNISTLETVAASHNYLFGLKSNNVAEWRFNNILLPDSNVNQAGSNGFIKYRIKPLNNLVNGNTIKNDAYIYFDFNLPVVTNTVNTAIQNKVEVKKITADKNSGIEIFPNPNTGKFYLNFENKNNSPMKLQITDLLGKIVFSEISNSGAIGIIDLSGYPNGMYLLKLQTNDKIYYRKILLEK